jgi:hypothetical protein
MAMVLLFLLLNFHNFQFQLFDLIVLVEVGMYTSRDLIRNLIHMIDQARLKFARTHGSYHE